MARKPKESQEQTQEQIAQEQLDAEAGFRAGFEGTDAVVPAPVEPPAEPAGEPAPEPVAAAAPEPSAEPAAAPAGDEPRLAGLTEDQIKALLAQSAQFADFKTAVEKQMRNAFGVIGELKQKLQQPSTPAIKREIKAEGLKRLKAEYPDLADLLAEDLGEVLSQSGPGLTQEAVNELVANRLTEQEKTLSERRRTEEVEALADAHPDWEAIRDSDDLELWLSTQSADYRGKFRNTNSATFISRGLDRFKAWKAQGEDHSQRSQRRLEANITPKGGAPSGPQVLSDEAAFRKGFESG